MYRGKGGVIYFAGFGKAPNVKAAAQTAQLDDDDDDEPIRRVVTCSKCGNKGHNARGCKEGEEQE